MGRKLIDITGKKLNCLIAIKHIHSKKWLFQCDCGNERIGKKSYFMNGMMKCCGKKCSLSRGKITHGFRKKDETNPDIIRIYRIWKGVRQRCLNKNNPSYYNYGGRGITIISSWNKFENFLAEMGMPPTNKHSLDRIDNNGNYSKQNCRWATNTEQTRNQRSNIKITIEGETKCLSEWCKIKKLVYSTIWGRIYTKGWDPLKAVMTKVRFAKKYKKRTFS
jgi:hypothetical protein